MALWHARNALEKLTTSSWGYKDGLDELAKKSIGLIDKEPYHNDGETYDWEMLELPYDYCSNIGVHPDDVGSASGLQAATGIILAEHAIYFILKQQEKASTQGMTLRRFV